MWDFLSDPANRTAIAFYAGGAATVIAGLWNAYLALRKKPAPEKSVPPASARRVTGGDGISAGGDILVEGDLAVTRNVSSKGAVALFVLGAALLAGGAYISGRGDHLQNSLKAGNDINAGTIVIGAPPPDGN